MVGEVTSCGVVPGKAKLAARTESLIVSGSGNRYQSGVESPSGAFHDTEYASLHGTARPGEGLTVRAGLCEMEAKPTFWGPCKFVANGFEREGLS